MHIKYYYLKSLEASSVSLNAKLSNSQFNKLKSGIKNRTEATLSFSSNLIGNSIDETNSLYKLLLADTKVSKIRKVFANGSSAKINFKKLDFLRSYN